MLLEQAMLRLHFEQLDALDGPTRMRAGLAVCDLLGLTGAMRGLGPDGALRPPPAWPLVDIVPVSAGRGGIECSVRTLLGGVVEAHVRLPVLKRGASYQDAIGDAVERGRGELERRLGGFVVGS